MNPTNVGFGSLLIYRVTATLLGYNSSYSWNLIIWWSMHSIFSQVVWLCPQSMSHFPFKDFLKLGLEWSLTTVDPSCLALSLDFLFSLGINDMAWGIPQWRKNEGPYSRFPAFNVCILVSLLPSVLCSHLPLLSLQSSRRDRSEPRERRARRRWGWSEQSERNPVCKERNLREIR